MANPKIKNENLRTEAEKEYLLEENLKSTGTKSKISFLAKVSGRKVRIIRSVAGVDIVVLTVIVKSDGKLEVYDYWGWGNG